jgi:poly-beta-hydroxyalkanoate depolymerase
MMRSLVAAGFSGRRFRETVYSRIWNFIRNHA